LFIIPERNLSLQPHRKGEKRPLEEMPAMLALDPEPGWAVAHMVSAKAAP
jgi:hypothetical protein